MTTGACPLYWEVEVKSEDIARLPNWARIEVWRLLQRIDSLEMAIDERDSKIEQTDTFVVNWGDESGQPLASGCNIGFLKEPRPGKEAANAYPDFLVRMTGKGSLEVHSAGTRLAVEPLASNCIQIRAVEQ